MRKKMICLITLMGLLALNGCGFNKQIIDLEYNYNAAIIKDVGEVEVSKWNDYEDGMVQVISKDGTVYLTHLSNVILIKR